MGNLTPSQKGAAAEAAITAAVIQLGLTVLRPLCEGRRYDLVVDLEPRLLRVQCKLGRGPLRTPRDQPLDPKRIRRDHVLDRRGGRGRRLLTGDRPVLLDRDRADSREKGDPPSARAR